MRVDFDSILLFSNLKVINQSISITYILKIVFWDLRDFGNIYIKTCLFKRLKTRSI